MSLYPNSISISITIFYLFFGFRLRRLIADIESLRQIAAVFDHSIVLVSNSVEYKYYFHHRRYQMSHLAHLLGNARDQVSDNTTSQETKKLKQHDPKKMNIKEAIEAVFTEFWLKFHILSDLEQEELEIELRLGMIISDFYRWKVQSNEDIVIQLSEQNRLVGSSLTFRAGVDETFVNELHSFVLRASEFVIEEQPAQRIKLDKNKNRYQFATDNSILSYEEKDKLVDCDLALLGRNYDLRIAVARERQGRIAPADLSLASIQFESERTKRRTSYKSRDKSLAHWKLDLTEVISRDLDTSGEYTTTKAGSPSSQLTDLELEIEMTVESKRTWLAIKDIAEAKVESQKLTASLCKLLDLIIPHDSDSILSKSPGIQLIPQNTPEWREIITEIHRINSQLNPGTASSQTQFLGCKPLNMNRRGLHRVRNSIDSYFMTEKSDGIRNLLYTIELKSRGPMAVLMNRIKAINLYLVPFGDLIGQALKVGTVLDGELVINLTRSRPAFLVFDVLGNEGVNVSQFFFERRLAILNNEIMKKCAAIFDLYKASAVGTNAIPLEICRKQYYGHLVGIGASPRTSIRDLIGNISLIGRDYVYKDSKDGRRHHKIDGIIFQPNRPYLFSTADPFLLKWKYAHLRSVDMQASPSPMFCSQLRGLNPPEIRIPLLCGGPDGILIDITRRGNEDFTMFGKYDQYRLMADMNDGSLPNKPRIVEVCFDESCGLWKYLKLRVDKDEPNYIDTVVGVLTEQGENISIEELELTLLPSASQRNVGLSIHAAVVRSKQALLDAERKKSAANI